MPRCNFSYQLSLKPGDQFQFTGLYFSSTKRDVNLIFLDNYMFLKYCIIYIYIYFLLKYLWVLTLHSLPSKSLFLSFLFQPLIFLLNILIYFLHMATNIKFTNFSLSRNHPPFKFLYLIS